jgi:hypothetical protein
MSNEAKVTTVISPEAVQVPLTPYEQLLDKYLDADQAAEISARSVAEFLISMGDKDPAVRRKWMLKVTRTGNKEATEFFTWARDTTINRAKARGEKNPNQKWKRIIDACKKLSGFQDETGKKKEEFNFIEEAARMIQNHLFKTDEGQCHATKQLWDRMQEAFLEDRLLKADA